MKISFQNYVEFRDNNPLIVEGLWQKIKSAAKGMWQGFKQGWSDSPSANTAAAAPAQQPTQQNVGANATLAPRPQGANFQAAPHNNQAASKGDPNQKNAGLINDLRYRFEQQGIDPNKINNPTMQSYLDEILATTRSGGQRDQKILSILQMEKMRSLLNNSGVNASSMNRQTLEKISNDYYSTTRTGGQRDRRFQEILAKLKGNSTAAQSGGAEGTARITNPEKTAKI